jgi:hypothetical protein
MIVVRPERNLIGGRCHAARHQRHVQAWRDLDRLQVVGSVVGSQRALLERTLETEQLFAVLAQLGLDECPEVNVRMVGPCSGRHPDNGQDGDENPGTDQRYAHGAILP